jgi:hypothetical protein
MKSVIANIISWELKRAIAGGFLCIALSLSVLVACASGPQVVDHGFEFDAIVDSPGIDVLDYAYGNEYRMTRAEPHLLKEGRINQSTNIHGGFPRGDFLYVKWRLRASGEVFDDRVDLRNRLPADITRQTIRFTIKERQLHVYLVTRNRRAEGSPAGPIRKYQDLEVIEIYPAQPKF